MLLRILYTEEGKELMRKEEKRMEKREINKAFCDENNIQAEWFKFDKGLAGFLVAMCEETTNEKGEFTLEDSHVLGLTTYAICKRLLDGEISEEIEAILNRKGMKLSKLAYNTAEEAIEKGRIRVAQCRENGKGKKPYEV